MISQIIRAMQLMIVLRIKEAPFKYCIYTNKALKNMLNLSWNSLFPAQYSPALREPFICS